MGRVKACNAIKSSDKLMLDLWLLDGSYMSKSGGDQERLVSFSVVHSPEIILAWPMISKSPKMSSGRMMSAESLFLNRQIRSEFCMPAGPIPRYGTSSSSTMSHGPLEVFSTIVHRQVLAM